MGISFLQDLQVYGQQVIRGNVKEQRINTTQAICDEAGDNLTISDLESATFNVGDFIHVGEVTLQVTSPRIPCGTFATRMGDPQWVKKFRHAERPGLYVRVVREGVIQAGDPVTIEKYSGETVSIVQMYRDHYDKDYSEELLRRYLNSPIDVRSREYLEGELQKLIS